MVSDGEDRSLTDGRPRDWIDAMLIAAKTLADAGWALLVILRNVVDQEPYLDNIHHSALNNLFARLVRAPGAAAPQQALEEAIDLPPQLSLQGYVLPNQIVRVSCVVNGLKLKGHLRDGRGLAWGPETEHRLVVDALAGKLTGRNLKPNAGGRRVTWVTPTTEIASLRAAEPSTMVATAVRERLGLGAGSNETLHWFEYVYPDGAFDGPGEPKLRTPTVADAGAWPLFRPHKVSSDRWGRTVNTRTLEQGFPEAVHPNGPPSALRVAPLGRESLDQKASDPVATAGFYRHLYDAGGRAS